MKDVVSCNLVLLLETSCTCLLMKECNKCHIMKIQEILCLKSSPFFLIQDLNVQVILY